MKFSTSTITTENKIVPWLSANGPLSYSPFFPPPKDYYFLYNFMFRGIFHKDVNLKRHYWFGDHSGKDNYSVCLLKNFWENARIGQINPVVMHEPVSDLINLEVPVAIFKHTSKELCTPYYLFMQHGSYLQIPVSEQPLIEDGFVLIYRGIGTSKQFNLHRMPEETAVIDHYRTFHSNYLSDSVRSFTIAHAGTFRCETGHLINSYELLFPELPHVGSMHDSLMHLLRNTNQCYTLVEHVAKHKFGPSYAAFKTPITNIRISTWFAGENEVKVLSLDRLMPIKATQCKFNPVG